MAEITSEKVKELRERSGAGIMDSKRALTDAEGDMDRALAILREQGLSKAGKKAHRETGQGLVEAYIHGGGRIGALVEINCETDFVGRTDDFKRLAHDLAMQVAATNPRYLSAEEKPEGEEGEASELCLLEQPFIREPAKSIRDLVNETIGKTGENI